MKKKLFFIRHGNTLANKYNLWNGSFCDLELTREGHWDACDLGLRMSKYDFDIIYSSPLKRAYQTAGYIAEYQKHNVDVVIEDNLQEINFGDAEGKTLDYTKKIYPKLWSDFYWCTLDTWDSKFPGRNSESKHDAFNRIYDVVFRALLEPDKTIAFVAHAGIMHALIVGLRLPHFNYSNCAVNIVEYDTVTKEFKLL